MESKIAEAISLIYQPIALNWSEEKSPTRAKFR